MERKEMRLLGQEGLDNLANLKIKIGEMQSGSPVPSTGEE